MSSTILKHYRQTTYNDRYTIEFRPHPSAYFEIYCTEHPGNRYDASTRLCHLYPSGKVCVAAGREPRTLDRAKAIAILWMDGYSTYIRTGQFPTGKKRINV